jgi:hypothetical protein
MANSHHSGFACERIDAAPIAAIQRVISGGNNLILANAASRPSEDRLKLPAHPGRSHGGAVVNARNRMGQTPLHYATLKIWPGGVFMANSHHSGFACDRIDAAPIAATRRVILGGNNFILAKAKSRSSDGANPAPGEKGFSEAAGTYCYTNGVRRLCACGKEPSRTGGV